MYIIKYIHTYIHTCRECEYGCVVSEAVPEMERVVTKVPAKIMPLHLKYDCPERIVKCSLCVQEVKAKVSYIHTYIHST